MKIGNKGPVLTPAEISSALGDLSKSALVDIAFDFLQRMHGEGCVTLAIVADDIGPVLRVRKDKMPKALRAAGGVL